MKIEQLFEVESECNRLLLRIEEYTTARAQHEQEKAEYAEKHPGAYFYGRDFPAHTAAIRRASMDLTRALAKLRKPNA